MNGVHSAAAPNKEQTKMRKGNWRFTAAAEKNTPLTGRQEVFLSTTGAKLQSAEEESTSPGVVRMKCVPYNDPGPHWRGTVEFAKGCFTESLERLENKEDKAYIFADGHMGRPDQILANSKADKVRAKVKFDDQDDGLYADVILPNTNAGRDIAELVGQGAVDACSVGVYIEAYSSKKPDPDSYEEDMTITQAQLEETSFVAFPRFEDTPVEMISEDEPQNTAKMDFTNAEEVKVFFASVAEMIRKEVTDAIDNTLSRELTAEAPPEEEDGADVIQIASWRQQATKIPQSKSWRELLANKEAI